MDSEGAELRWGNLKLVKRAYAELSGFNTLLGLSELVLMYLQDKA